jgi:hypothetical protein
MEKAVGSAAARTARRSGAATGATGAATTEHQVVVRYLELNQLVLEMSAAGLQGRAPADFHLVAVGLARIQEELAHLQPRCRSSGFALQAKVRFNPHGIGERLDDDSRRRGVRLVAIAPPRAGVDNPLLLASQPHTRCGPTVGSALLLDRTCVVVPGLPTPHGADTAWLTTRSDVVSRTSVLWDLTYRESVAGRDAGWPSVTRRQLEVARGIALGRTTATMARELGVSVRTVATEVCVLRRLSRSSTAQAIDAWWAAGGH